MARFRTHTSLVMLAAITLAGCDASSLTARSPLTTFAGGTSNTGNSAPTNANASEAHSDIANPEKPGASEKAGKEAGPVKADGTGAEAPAPAASAAPSAAEEQKADDEGLRAGTVDDNAKFPEFLGFQKRYSGQPMRTLDVSERYVIKVVDSEGHGVSNAEVTVTAGDKAVFTGRSYADGQLLFHPRAVGADAGDKTFQVTGTKGLNTANATFARSQEGVWTLKLPKPETKPSPRLEVLFMLDATGSMGGEIEKLQKSIDSISSRIHALPNQPNVKFGLISYRDQDDDYVVKKTDLTSDLQAFKTALNATQADGGGDYPEDMEAALAEGVNKISWSGEDTLRLTFLVADAPPHVDYPQSIAYTTSVKNAAGKGIKFYPIGCSGLEPEGEYVMRQLAQYTMGQFIFITRGGDEESGGGEVSHTVDKFQEGRLDDIVVDIVKGELDHLGK